jgi:phytoene dehydrogenase-like protein/NAD-dependent dihydropyrimidine dehydrogenase PreA subunit
MVTLDSKRCCGCGYCHLVCPSEAISVFGEAFIDQEKCTDCNECIYACPCGALESSTPFHEKPKGFKEKYDAVVIGSGIAGLLVAGGLSKAGKKVVLLERMSFIGGKFTYFDYRGYRIPTGAWVNGWPRSNIGKLCKKIGAEYDLTPPLPTSFLVMRYTAEGKLRQVNGPTTPETAMPFIQSLPKEDRDGVMKALLKMASREKLPEDISLEEWAMQFSRNEDFLSFLTSFTDNFWSLPSCMTPAGAFSKLTLFNAEVEKDFRLPVGGTKAVVNSIADVVKKNGGEVRTRSPVTRITIEDNKAIGVEVGGTKIKADVVIHNGGPRSLLVLAGRENFPGYFARKVDHLIPLPCMGLLVGLKKPLFPETAFVFAPNARRIKTIMFPKRYIQAVAPKDKYALWGFGHTLGDDPKQEINYAIKDIEETFPEYDFKNDVDFILPSLYHKSWPGCESAATFNQVGKQRLGIATPVKNLYLVGADTGEASIAGDTAGVSAIALLNHLLGETIYQ